MSRFHKYSLLLDEGFPPKNYFPKLNSIHNLKHVVKDFKKGGISDADVFKLAIQTKRLIVTYNYKDFVEFAKTSKESGVIGVSANIQPQQIDKKLLSLLKKCSYADLYGRFNYISGET